MDYLTPSEGDFHITSTFNTAQQVIQVNGNQIDSYHPAVLGQFSYTAFGKLNQIVDGCTGTGCSGLVETYAYNNRLQPVVIELGTSTNPNSYNCLVYNYYGNVSNPTSCAAPSQGTGDNGNVMGVYYQDSLNNLGHTTSNTYDALNRLTTSVAAGSWAYNLTYSYDRYGNMQCVINGNTNGTCPQWGVSGTTNQLTGTGYSYDAAGEMTNDGAHSYQYDAEGRLVSVDSGSTATYVYNALGQRVQEHNPNDPNQNYYLQTYYDAFGEQAVVSSNGEITEDFFPGVGGRNYVKFAAGETFFLHADATGTTGIITTETNGTAQDQVYYPWGGQWVPGSGGYDIRFGSLEERDKATSFDPTLARQYTNNFGRWMTPDPDSFGLGPSNAQAINPSNPESLPTNSRPFFPPSFNISNPQSLNRYAYVLNNPMTSTDPTGRCSALDYYSTDPTSGLTEFHKDVGPCPPPNPLLSLIYGCNQPMLFAGPQCAVASAPTYGGFGVGSAPAPQPAPQPKPSPMPTVGPTPPPPTATRSGNYADYLFCIGDEAIILGFGNEDRAFATFGLNIAPFALSGAPPAGIAATIIATTYDLKLEFEIRETCMEEVYGHP